MNYFIFLHGLRLVKHFILISMQICIEIIDLSQSSFFGAMR